MPFKSLLSKFPILLQFSLCDHQVVKIASMQNCWESRYIIWPTYYPQNLVHYFTYNFTKSFLPNCVLPDTLPVFCAIYTQTAHLHNVIEHCLFMYCVYSYSSEMKREIMWQLTNLMYGQHVLQWWMYWLVKQRIKRPWSRLYMDCICTYMICAFTTYRLVNL